uniref:Right handed beta helix domain-containing protein n=1 Tax=Amphimedon queenslandica TaxID=400682 RepID=A0A1X7U815_AMPQE
MSLLLVVVLLFFSSSCSVSSGQYYVSDDCSSVTQSPCNPLSVYAGNMSQYNNTIFYFIGTSVINFTVTMNSVQNITLHGLDQFPTIHCKYNDYFYYDVAIYKSSHISFSNLSFQDCRIYFVYSSNVTIASSIFGADDVAIYESSHISFSNLLFQECSIYFGYSSNITIASSVFKYLRYLYNFVSLFRVFDMCYNELHHYSLSLINVTVTNGSLVFYMNHGTSYNISVLIDNVNIISSSENGTHSQQFKECNIKGVESRSTIVIEDSQFYNNDDGLLIGTFRDYIQLSNYHIDITLKSCSSHDNSITGLLIVGSLSTSAHISVIDTELVGNWRNQIAGCLSIILNNTTVTNSLSTGLVIISSVVTVENRLVFKNNTGVVGGGMAINGSSVVALSPSANLEFIDNHATYKGGGIYLDDISHITETTLNTFTFKGNTAAVAGNDIYGVDSQLEYTASLTLANLSTSSDAIMKPHQYGMMMSNKVFFQVNH